MDLPRRPEEGPRTAFSARRRAEGPVVPEQAGARRRLGPGERIGHFVLVRFIAQGGMGQVWEARDEALRAPVALKLVLPELVDERALAFFSREARAGGRLTHPNVVRTLAHGSDDGLAWIAQELVEGSWTLKDALDEVRAEEHVPRGYYREVARLVAAVADGLHAVHAAGVIHRDLKPANILIDPDDAPKVTDFGLARVEDDSFRSQSGALAGTWGYMSPEQVSARRADLDHRSDVFSLGVVLYEMLTLRRPFEGDTTHQVTERILRAEPIDPRRVRSRCPRDLAVICLKALEKDPTRRYGSMGEFADDLRRYLSNEPIVARPPGRLALAGKWVRRHPAWSSSGAVVLLAAVVILLLLLRAMEAEADATAGWDRASGAAREASAARDRADEARRLAERRAYAAFLLASQAALAEGNVLEARRLLDQCAEELRGWEWRHLDTDLRLSTWTAQDPGWALQSAAFGPGGRRIASVTHDGWLTIRDADSGAVTASHDLGVERVNFVDWAPSGDAVVLGGARGLFRAVDPTDGQLLWDAPRGDDILMGAAWSPDASRIGLIPLSGPLLILDADSGAALQEVQVAPNSALDLAWSPDGSRLAVAMTDGSVTAMGADGDQLWTQRGGTFTSLASVAWHPSGQSVAVARGDFGVELLDAGTGAPQGFHAVGVLVNDVAWSGDGERTVYGCVDGSVRVWDARRGVEVAALRGHADSVFGVDVAAGSDAILSSGYDDLLALWDICTLPAARALPIGPGSHSHLDVGGTPETVAMLGRDGVVRLRELGSGDPRVPLKGAPGRPWAVAWSPDGGALATGSIEGPVAVWDAADGSLQRVLEGHRGQVNGVSWSPDGARLVSGATDGTIRGWDRAEGRALWTIGPEDLRSVTDVAWAPAADLVAAATEEPAVRFLDGDGAERAIAPKPRRGNVLLTSDASLPHDPVAWHPGGGAVVSGTDPGPLLVLDATSGETLLSLPGHRADVLSVAWSPDGGRIASAAEGGDVRVWDAATGDCLLTLSAEGASALAWSADGSRLLAAAGSELLVWESDPEAARAFSRIVDRHRRLLARVNEVNGAHPLGSEVFAAIEADTTLDEDLRADLLLFARERSDPPPWRLNEMAWPLVDPDRTGQTDVVRGLVLARAMVAAAPDEPAYLDTLAWALVANGQHEEAVEVSARALELVPDGEREAYRAYLARVQAAAEAGD